MASHEQVVAAARRAVDIEEQVDAGWSFLHRLRWLTEAELASRMHTAFTCSLGIVPSCIRMSAQGKKQAGGTNHDIEFYEGQALTGAVEVLYCFAAKGEDSHQQQPAKYLNDDVAWLLAAGDPRVRHVVAFVPRMMPGYTVQKNSKPFRLDGEVFDKPDDVVLLTGVLQAPALTTSARDVLTQVVIEVPNPAAGKSPRWSLGDSVLLARTDITVCGVRLVRSVVRPEEARLWAVVITRA